MSDILRSLYDWALRQAKTPYAAALLFFVALIEPCLFPLPPDTLLIPMALARRDKAFALAAIATAGSVIGAVIGYLLGALIIGVLLATISFLNNRGGTLARISRPRWVNAFFGKAQLFSSAYMGFAHGLNDAQTTMGIIALALFGFYASRAGRPLFGDLELRT